MIGIQRTKVQAEELGSTQWSRKIRSQKMPVSECICAPKILAEPCLKEKKIATTIYVKTKKLLHRRKPCP